MMDFGSAYIFSPAARAAQDEEGKAVPLEGVAEAAEDDFEVVDDDDLESDLTSFALVAEEDDDSDADEAAATVQLTDAPMEAFAPAELSAAAAPPAAPRRGSGGIMSRLLGFAAGGGQAAPNSAAQREHARTNRVRMRKKKNRGHGARAAPSPGAYRRRVDTNVLSLSLSTLATDAQMATGDPNFCTNCQAALSAESVLQTPAEAGAETEGGECTHVWTCEFCGNVNYLDLDEPELPAAGVDTVDFLLEPPPPAQMARSSSTDENMVIFVIDTSGSMCVTQEVEGRISLRGGGADMSNLRQRGDGDQYLPGQNRNATYISRLQCVQAAIDAQLDQMARETPSRRVGLVTFSTQVTIVGDGSSSEQHIEGDRLNNLEELMTAGRNCTLNRSVGDVRDALREKVFSLQEEGQTALGPAVAVALGMAATSRGSKIVICTDGVANIGLGALDEVSDEDREEAEGFYAQVGNLAMENGVTIDVIGMEGADCDLENLGAMAEATEGTVTRVNPVNLTNDFSGILANPVIATSVSATLLLHAGMSVREEYRGGTAAAGAGADEQRTRVTRDIGNVTSETEITFEYSVKSRDEMQRLGFADITAVPFQVQVHFTKLDGSRCVRVMTQSRPLTSDRAQVQAQANMSVLGAHVSKQCAQLAQAGDYTESRRNARAWSNMMAQCATVSTAEQQDSYNMFVNDLASLDGNLARAEMEEEAMGGGALQTASSRRSARSRNDELSAQLYAFKRKGKKSYR